MIGPIPIENINFNNSNNINTNNNYIISDNENDDDEDNNENTINTNNNNSVVGSSNHDLWVEHERRQRTIRFLMMFLMMLILLDGEQQASNEEIMRKRNKLNLRRGVGKGNGNGRNNGDSTMMDDTIYSSNKTIIMGFGDIDDNDDITNTFSSSSSSTSSSTSNKNININPNMTRELFKYRQELDNRIMAYSTSTQQRHNSRYQSLVQLNNGVEYEKDMISYLKNHSEVPYDELKLVYHYPTNITGYYRGYWTRYNLQKKHNQDYNNSTSILNTSTSSSPKILTQSEQIKNVILNSHPDLNIFDYNDMHRLFILPRDTQLYGSYKEQLELSFPHHVVFSNHYHDLMDSLHTANNETSTIASSDDSPKEEPLYLTESEGRLHFHLYSRSIRGMRSLSLIDGYMKIHGINDYGFANPKKHLLLRVHGIMIHYSGKISLVSNVDPLRSVFTNLLLNDEDGRKEKDIIECSEFDFNLSNQKRRLQESLDDLENQYEYNIDSTSMHEKILNIRNRALWMYQNLFDSNLIGGSEWKVLSSNVDYVDDAFVGEELKSSLHQKRRLSGEDPNTTSKYNRDVESMSIHKCDDPNKHWISSISQPYPYVPQDTNITKNSNTMLFKKIYSNIPEGLYNTDCEFEINLNVNETKVLLKDWRQMLQRVTHDINKMNPFVSNHNTSDSDWNGRGAEALVMDVFGSMESQNCDFGLSFNATALRTDWEKTKYKVSLYSLFMMLSSLAQIVILLRQIIYAQQAMVATRVSILSIGWQAVIDAIICIANIMLCMMIPPVSTAFFLVALFKFLLFYVVAMRYMSMIMEARCTSRGLPSSASDVRRRFASIQLKFYVTLLLVLLLAWHLAVGQSRRKLVLMSIYSFWTPQIIYNAVTESKKPLHMHYIYGNSITRLNLPLLLFGVPKNFMQEIEPEFPLDLSVCWMLLVWVFVQTALLIGQSKYGARFMIPARFLPPKYNYSRPIPKSLLPSHSINPSRSHTSSDECDTATLLENDVMNDTKKGPRNRKEKRSRNSEGNGITTVHEEEGERPTIDCVICYNAIDVMDKRAYMLAPCDHLFHATCLKEWMEIKMECPICRTDLPA